MIRKRVIDVLLLGAAEPFVLLDFLIGMAELAAIGIAAGLAWLVRQRIRRRLRRQLVERAQPLCSKCGHSLTGNVSGICPECGTEVERP